MKITQKSSKKMLEYTLYEGILADDIFKSITEIINQKEFTGKVKTLNDFSEEEILAMEKLYKAKIRRNVK